MTQRILVLCDKEADYARQMAAFLAHDRNFPWEIIVYTNRREMEAFLGKTQVDLVLISESLAEEQPEKLNAGHVILLNESGFVRFPELKNIDKYQEAENVRRELIRIFAGWPERVYPNLQDERKTRLIGLYSPVRRCLQTGFGITCANLLSERSRVLFLSFEYFGSLQQMAAEKPEMDMEALLYYLEAEPQKFFLYLKTMIKKVGNCNYISPMRNVENLPCVTADEWMKLLERCQSCGEFDYIVLDLNEGLQGVMQILQQCDRIFTMVREDSCSRYKLERYEELLVQKGYEQIREKTVKVLMPKTCRLPDFLEDYTRGELAEYARKQLKELYEI